MGKSLRCLFDSDFKTFLTKEKESIFGVLCDNYHGDALTTTREAWSKEIEILQEILTPWEETDGHIIFEYDIPRLGKRIDVVLLLNGIIFCLEFKVGESKILENDVDQVLDYALDLKYFHEKSRELWIAPVLIATKAAERSHSYIRSNYDDKVLEPICCNDNTRLDSLLTKSLHTMGLMLRLILGKTVVITLPRQSLKRQQLSTDARIWITNP